MASIPNAERKSFRLDPKYLELLFGTPWNNWNDGVIYIASKYSDKRIMELFALRFLANAPSDVMYYEKPIGLVFTKLTLSTFLSKSGGSQVALLKHANDALSNKALNVEDQELVALASARLQKVSNVSYVKQTTKYISLDEYTLVPRNDNEAIDLMRGYTLTETDDLYKQLDAVLGKMARYKGAYFGQEEAELWFKKGLYEYIYECSQILDQKDPNKKELEFALIIIGVLGIKASSTGNVLLTREGFDKIIQVQTKMEIGSKYCTRVFDSGIKKYRTRATYEFYSQLTTIYYGMVKY